MMRFDNNKSTACGCQCSVVPCLTLSQTTNLRLFKLKDFADDNFKFDKNGKTFSKPIENTAGKG